MLTPEQQAAADKAAQGANNGASLDPKEGAKFAESLKAAQDSAEAARKENANLKSMIEERDSQSAEFKERLEKAEAALQKANPARKAAPSAGELAKQLRKMAADGDLDALATEELAREVAREEFKSIADEKERNASFDRMESFQSAKATEHGFKSVEEFRAAIDQYGAGFQHLLPHEQMERAYAGWSREAGLKAREAKIIEQEKANGTWQDPGTDGAAAAASSDKTKKRSWRDDKTQQDKFASVASL